MSSLSGKEAVLLLCASTPGLPFKERAFGAFPPFGKVILFGAVMHPMDVELDGPGEFLFAKPFPCGAGVFAMASNALSGQPIGLRIPLPIAIGEPYVTGLC